MARQKIMAGSWQVLWTELEIYIFSENNSVLLKPAHARGTRGHAPRKRFLSLVILNGILGHFRQV